MSELIAASTTDPLSAVRETVGLPAEPTEEEKREAEEMQTERRENGHCDPEQSPHYQKRFNKIFAQKSEAERRASQAEAENAELRERLAAIERNQINAPLDRALAAEDRAAELEERLRAYEPHGTNGYANAPPASAEEQSPLEQTPVDEAPPAEQHANEGIPPEHQAFLAFQEHHNKKLMEILSKRSDGNELVARADGIIQGMRQDVNTAISHALQNSPNSEHVMVYLMEHPDLLHQANQLSPQDAFAATLRLAGRLEATNGQPRTVVVSKAPPPISSLKGTARTETKDPGQMSLPEYRAWYDRNFSRGRR